MVNATGMRAVFQFLYPSTAQTGSFFVHGSFGQGRMLKLLAGDWIEKPIGNVVPISLLGHSFVTVLVVSASGLTYKGEVLHTGCGGFEVNRSSYDLGDPFTHRSLSLPGGTAPRSG